MADQATNEAEVPLSRDQARSRRKRAVRARSISVRRMPRRELELGAALYPPDEHADLPRPATRARCEGVPRPCPFVSCQHHLYLDVSARTGAIKLNFPDLEPDELPAESSCALDIADRGGLTLEAVGEVLNLTRERVRQVEVKAGAKLAAAREMVQLRDLAGLGESVGKRRLPLFEEDDGFGDDESDSPTRGS